VNESEGRREGGMESAVAVAGGGGGTRRCKGVICSWAWSRQGEGCQVSCRGGGGGGRKGPAEHPGEFKGQGGR
jgi:hypothetical protein